MTCRKIADNLVVLRFRSEGYDPEEGKFLRKICFTDDLVLSDQDTNVTVDQSNATSVLPATKKALLMSLSVGGNGAAGVMSVQDTGANVYYTVSTDDGKTTMISAASEDQPLAVIPAGSTIDLRGQAMAGGTVNDYTWHATFKLVPVFADAETE